ncbi:Ubiquitin-conjugating enzyme E2 5 [Castilleja foliolosa]|uniref:Ubiquitin-conjugating enzyme E2 5 n=1 Tax=Castilleja foliolosa TaxID=1961234 RepID=A0ABD3CZZ3_9LAMI
MSSSTTTNKRMEIDMKKLLMNGYKVELIDNSIQNFNVELHGPKDSLYEGFVWRVMVKLDDNHPYKRPSIEFVDRIFHPNIGDKENDRSVFLNVLTYEWSPVFDMLNVFEIFIPQLLLYPNPHDPSNGNCEAAYLMCLNPIEYQQKVKEYCEKYAKRVNAPDEASRIGD